MDLPEFRRTVGTFPTGVTIVTTHVDGEDYGLTVSAFSSLSLDPPMVMVALANESSTLERFDIDTPIGVSILSEGQLELAKLFATRGADRFADTMVHRVGGSVPLLDGASAWFFGRVSGMYVAGDHTILAVAVEEMSHEDNARPLLYQRGSLREWPL